MSVFNVIKYYQLWCYEERIWAITSTRRISSRLYSIAVFVWLNVSSDTGKCQMDDSLQLGYSSCFSRFQRCYEHVLVHMRIVRRIQNFTR